MGAPRCPSIPEVDRRDGREPMTIVFASPSIPPDFSGGGLLLYRQARFMAREGHEITVLTSTEDDGRIEKDLEIVRVRPRHGVSSGNKLVGIGNALALLFSMYHAIRRARPQVLHVTSYGVWSMMAHAAARLSGVPTIVETTLVGADDPMTVKGFWGGRWRFGLLRSANIIVNMSRALDDLCQEAGIAADRRRIIGNFADVNRFTPATETEKERIKSELGLERFDRILISVAIIRPRKGIGTLIEAFSKMDLGEEVGLVLVGPTAKNEENRLHCQEMRERVEEAGLEDRVVFTGEVCNVEEWLRAGDVFLFASEQEGFGTVQVEAMATGLPVVARRIPGITDDIVTHGYDGFIVEDVEEFVREIGRLLSDDELYEEVSLRARETAVKSFSEEAILDRYLELYDELSRR